jgi:23S rRNA pseudoU1915 N3-methylase RlmH
MTIQDSNLKLLIKEAFRLIAAREGVSKKDVWQRYAERFHISEHTVRGWEAGLTRPQELAQIEELAADAITIGKVDERWLRSYLQSQGIPRIAKDLQERLYDLLETQLRKDANFATGPQSISIKFANGRTVKTVITRHSSELGQALEMLNAQFDHPVMVVVGGADGLSEERSKRIEALVEEVVAATELLTSQSARMSSLVSVFRLQSDKPAEVQKPAAAPPQPELKVRPASVPLPDSSSTAPSRRKRLPGR